MFIKDKIICKCSIAEMPNICFQRISRIFIQILFCLQPCNPNIHRAMTGKQGQFLWFARYGIGGLLNTMLKFIRPAGKTVASDSKVGQFVKIFVLNRCGLMWGDARVTPPRFYPPLAPSRNSSPSTPTRKILGGGV